MANFIGGLQREFELSDGGRIELEISPNRVIRQFLSEQNMPIPQPVKIVGLIDTGATASCIDTKYINQLALKTSGYVRCKTAWGLRYPPVCILSITIPLDNEAAPWKSDYHSCAAFNNLSVGGEGALIGLDILKDFHFIVDGPNSHFKLLLPEVGNHPPSNPYPMEGTSYFDHQAGCFHRLVDGEWKQYSHLPQQEKRSFLSRVFRR